MDSRAFVKCGLYMAMFMLCMMGLSESFAAGIKVVVRYDDYSSYGTEKGRLKLERSLFDAVGKMGGSTLVGVIPFPGVDYPASADAAVRMSLTLSEEKLSLLRSQAKMGTIVVGLHGFNHRPNKLSVIHSEFVGVSENQQALLIGSAKRALEAAAGVRVRSFIPPFNTYDAATLRALVGAGFDLISASAGQPVAINLPLRYLPSAVYPASLKQVVQQASSRGIEDVLIVTTIHAYDFEESGEDLAEFRKDRKILLEPWLRELKTMHDSGQISLVAAVDSGNLGEDLSPARYISNKRLRDNWISNHGLIPISFGLRPLDGLYYKREVADKMWMQQMTAFIGIYGGIMLVVAFAVSRFLREATTRARFVRTVGIAVLLAVAVALALAAKPLLGSFHHSLIVGVASLVGVIAAAAVRRMREPDWRERGILKGAPRITPNGWTSLRRHIENGAVPIENNCLDEVCIRLHMGYEWQEATRGCRRQPQPPEIGCEVRLVRPR